MVVPVVDHSPDPLEDRIHIDHGHMVGRSRMVELLWVESVSYKKLIWLCGNTRNAHINSRSPLTIVMWGISSRVTAMARSIDQ